jgi:hypothetical protein
MTRIGSGCAGEGDPLDTGVVDAFASFGGGANRHQSIVDARPRVAHSFSTATVKKGRMNNETSQVVDALLGMVWWALPTGTPTFSAMTHAVNAVRNS